jgi:hypothetical protein
VTTVPSLRERRWSAAGFIVVISVLTVVMGTFFATSYMLLLGDPVPHRIAPGFVDQQPAHVRTAWTLSAHYRSERHRGRAQTP